MEWAKRLIQEALDNLPYDAFVEDIEQTGPCVFDATVSHDASSARSHEIVVLDPATETFSVQSEKRQ